MRNLAYLLKQRGWSVVGTDAQIDGLAEWSALQGVHILDESAAYEALATFQLVIYSDALSANHPLLERADAGGTRTMLYSEAAAQLTAAGESVAVAGTHGKSSTAALLAHILIATGHDPTVLLGAGVQDWEGRGARVGSSSLFVIEADEYRDHFLTLTLILTTPIILRHLMRCVTVLVFSWKR